MSVKTKDNKNRWRSKTVGFRVSPEEWGEIERLVKLSGMSKQDYIMSRLENKEITVAPNPRVVKALRNEIVTLTNILKEVQVITNIGNEITVLVKILTQLIIEKTK